MRARISSSETGAGADDTAGAASFFADVPAVGFVACANAAGASVRQQRRTRQGNAWRFTVHLLGAMSGEVDYMPLHLAVPVLRLRIRRPEHLEMPLAAAPRLDHFRRGDVDEDLGERASFRIALEVIRRLVPRERRIEHHRQEQVVSVVDDDQLAAGALQRRVIDEVLLRAVGADVALERELARDDLFDRDFLVPAVAAVFLLAARLGNLFRAAQRAARLRY